MSTEGRPSRVENVENNEQTSLLGGNLDSWTPLWQHDNAWIRLPAQLTLSPARYHVLFSMLFISTGIPLCIGLSRKELPWPLLLLDSFILIAWAIFSRLAYNLDDEDIF
ncbi:hypothetical protein CC77DRAFT_1021630 [Alternaria alternata]|jgi:hypothetical protein|uniref:Uncharacterized protein n=1 Tax=Alternaria alternata TaxID=5599 RepID=A0A177DIF0_ALTAL|nr:hypothetical protein CC77DRAFT_1021630 [Alternaria alternata]KAH8632502.1 hypothetical protein IG631_14185 [Alternaria alternata]OAG19533.1 hypothetical protein CC77DRAFT_1021630 [Alternaria alternata]